MERIQRYLTKNPYWRKNQNPTDPRYQEYQKHGPKGAMLHSIGCPQPDAMVLIRSWDSPDYKRACIHGFIDANNGTVYQTMPWHYRAPHAAGDATNTHIGIEMCEPDCIRYTSGSNFTCSDVPRAREMVRRTYLAAVELFAQICTEHGWDPLEDGVIISHREGYKRGIASNHGDPEHLWKGLGMGYTMDGFRKDVKKAMIDLTTGTLRPGDKGEDVRKVQFVLNLANYYHGALDGSYGEKTTQAVKDFQGANGLEADGKCGPKTQAVLWGFNFVVNRSVDKPDVKYTDVPDDIWYAKEIAKATELGIVKGVGNGEFDPERPVTRAECAAIAVRTYEKILRAIKGE